MRRQGGAREGLLAAQGGPPLAMSAADWSFWALGLQTWQWWASLWRVLRIEGIGGNCPSVWIPTIGEQGLSAQAAQPHSNMAEDCSASGVASAREPEYINEFSYEDTEIMRMRIMLGTHHIP